MRFLSDAGPEIRELAELLGAPVATSYAAKGIVSEDHAQSVGNLGWLGHPSAHEYIREYADVVLAVGFSFSDLSTCWWTEGMPFVEQNRFIQIDIDANQIGRTYPVEVGLLGDAKATLHEIVDELSTKEVPQNREANQELIEKVKTDFYMDIPGEEGGATGMEPLRVVEELRRVLAERHSFFAGYRATTTITSARSFPSTPRAGCSTRGAGRRWGSALLPSLGASWQGLTCRPSA